MTPRPIPRWSRMHLALWLTSHLRISQLIAAVGLWPWVSAGCWKFLESDHAFVAAMDQGMTDVEAGRVKPWDSVR